MKEDKNMKNKYLIFSDCHGSISSMKRILEIYEEEKCDKLICLGDILYHGPRNNLPNEYNPKEVAELIKNFKGDLLMIRGNCDGRVDEMVTGTKMHNFYAIKNMMFTHGDLLKKQNSKLFKKVVFYGHTHIMEVKKVGNTYYINPGSVTIPKKGEASFMILEDNVVKAYNMNKELILEEELK